MAGDSLLVPKAYELGLPHNNCLKGGQVYWAHLLRVLPDFYACSGKVEEETIRFLGRPSAILWNRIGSETKPLALEQLRERIQGLPAKAAFLIGMTGVYGAASRATGSGGPLALDRRPINCNGESGTIAACDRAIG